MSLSATARVELAHPDQWLEPIVERLLSFGANRRGEGRLHRFIYPFGEASIRAEVACYELHAVSDTANGLARLRELLAMAVELHARSDAPVICWDGALADLRLPPQFREMRVVASERLTPRMQRVTLAGEDLYRFEAFEGLHARILFPRPSSKWPTMGPNGLPVWPDEPERPEVRVYTVRYINAAAGRMVIDMVMHGDDGVGGTWARKAQAGDIVGILGPVGRPLRPAGWLMMGADQTGLPALSRLIEKQPAGIGGEAIVEVEDASEQVPIAAPPGFEVHWLFRDGGPSRLVEEVLGRDWSHRSDSFGWFAGEHGQAHIVREHWRGTLGLGRDRTLVAGYWRRGEKGAMAKV